MLSIKASATGLVSLAKVELRVFLAVMRTPAGAEVQALRYGTPVAPTLTQLTRPRGLAEARRDAPWSRHGLEVLHDSREVELVACAGEAA